MPGSSTVTLNFSLGAGSNMTNFEIEHVMASTWTAVGDSGVRILPGTIVNGSLSNYSRGLTYFDMEPEALTPEQRAEREELRRLEREEAERRRIERDRRHEEWRQYEEERTRQRQAAYDRAKELLESMLNEEQLASYRDTTCFDVTGSHGNRYRISPGSNGNIAWIDENGDWLGRLCAHPSFDYDWLPDPDVALGQMLALITDEPAFIAMANVHAGRRPEFELEGAVSV